MRQSQQDIECRVISAVKDFARSIYLGGKIVADMSALVDTTAELPLANFDYWERLIRSEFSKAMVVSTQSTWNFYLRSQQLLTWLDLISWDGYRRERALRAISGTAPNAFFFSLALRRLNDWVPQVRYAAREKLPKIAEASDPEDIADALAIALSNWNSWGRIEEEDKQVFLQIITTEPIADALKSKLMFSPSGPMPTVFAQLGRTSILDGCLAEIAEHAIQPAVRAKAYRSLFEKRIVWIEGRKWEWTDIRYCKGRLRAIVSERKIDVHTSFFDLLKKSSEDRSSIVRRVSAEFLIRDLEILGDQAKVFAERFASDKSNSVSERGRFALKKLETAT